MAQARRASRPGAPSVGRRTVWRLALAAILGGAAMLLLWWVDPGRLAWPVCAFHAMTGLHCPGCGATRATHELLNGRVLSALHHNALWAATLPLVVYAGVSEGRRFICGRPLSGDLLRRPAFFVVIAALALLFGLLRNLPVYPFALLAPPG